jgi:hypothetical protein
MEGVMQIAIGGTVISKPTSRALKDVETRIARGGPALESLRSERDYYRGEIDDALITGKLAKKRPALTRSYWR